MIFTLANVLAPIISVALFIPQFRLVWLQRNHPGALAAVSRGTQWLIIANAVCWFLIAWDTRNVAVGVPGLINLPMAVWVLVLKRRADRRVAGEEYVV